jgi:hypothetical protein
MYGDARFKRLLAESLLKKRGDVPISPLLQLAALLPSAGTIAK